MLVGPAAAAPATHFWETVGPATVGAGVSPTPTINSGGQIPLDDLLRFVQLSVSAALISLEFLGQQRTEENVEFWLLFLSISSNAFDFERMLMYKFLFHVRF